MGKDIRKALILGTKPCNMRLIYDLGIRIYFLGILFASVFNHKAKLWISGRSRLLDRIAEEVDPDQPMTWVHCSSLGEFEQGRPVIEKIRKEFPEKKILLTFYSPSGYEVRKNYGEASHVFYLPLDTKRNVRKFLELVTIEQAFFVKYEFWHHFLSGLKSQNIPAYLISGIFREKQVFFKWYGSWYLKILHTFEHLFVQQKSSLDLLSAHGITNASVSGDTRFDRVYEITRKVGSDERFQSFCGDSTVIVAGSTWPADEDIIIRFMNESGLSCKWIIAPHEIHEQGIKKLIGQIPGRVQRYTDLLENELENTDVLVIDSIGLLSSLFQYASITYIGGGFGNGIHNTLEAAAFGKPVIFGPNFSRFQEAIDLQSCNAAFPISGFEEFKSALTRLIADPGLLKKSGDSAGEYVKSMLGASTQIVDFALKSKGA